jgi:tripartite ATP-independent transporter DctP family solute receptor
MKKFLTLMLTVALIGSFTVGCNSGGNGSDVTPGGDAGGAGDEPILIQYAHADSDQRSNNLAGLQFKDFMEANSDGRVKVEVYPNGQLGDDQELIKGVQLGTVQVFTGSAGNVGAVFGEALDVLSLPYLYHDYDSWTEGLMEKGAGEIYNELLEETGLYNITFLYDGARNVNSIVKPIYTVDDMKGLKIRCMATNIFIDMYKGMGANPTPMDFGEVYTGLAQGTIEAQDNPPGLTCDKKFYEVTNYYSLTQHSIPPSVVTTSIAFLDSLPNDIRDLFIEGMNEACADKRQMEYDLELGFIQEISDNDCAVNEVTDIEGFRDAVKPIYDKFRDAVGDDIIDRLIATGR